MGCSILALLNISVHLCGSAYAYEGGGGNFSRDLPPVPGRPQGSLINQQKRAIANAIEWIRLQGHPKPLIFVCTSPGKTNASNENGAIKKFTANLRNGYNCRHYVWVRELTKMGFPHFHFVAALPRRVDFVTVSRYWSGLFDRDDVNSVRFGTNPEKGRREYYVKNQSMAWYLSKYLGKGLGKQTSHLVEAGFPASSYKKTVRSFQISQEVRMMSLPIVYTANYSFHQPDEMVLSASGHMVQKPALCVGRSYQDDSGQYFNPHAYEWKQHPLHKVFFGIKKTIKHQLELDAKHQRTF